MHSASTQPPLWTYAQPVAWLKCGALTAEVNVERPQLGLQNLRWQASPLSAQILGVRWETDPASLPPGRDPRWPMLPAEAYVRASDLVATYLAEPDWPYRPQIYWRANVLAGEPQALGSLSLLVSVQTDLLDTRPQLSLVSHLAAEEIVHITVSDEDYSVQVLTKVTTHIFEPRASVTCLLARLPGGRTSYIECAPTSDFRELKVSPANDQSQPSQLQWQLFNDFLEKGVIRRGQVHTAFLPRENDVELAANCCRAVEMRPLPLTT